MGGVRVSVPAKLNPRFMLPSTTPLGPGFSGRLRPRGRRRRPRPQRAPRTLFDPDLDDGAVVLDLDEGHGAGLLQRGPEGLEVDIAVSVGDLEVPAVGAVDEELDESDGRGHLDLGFV